ncbi:hypothetical protein [Limihaloglobus sulfuriphilus]|nr:hypothetical protein [Limihaloglobus sulfuriphilus]
MRRQKTMRMLWVAILMSFTSMIAMAADEGQSKPKGEPSATDLAKKAQNPVADMISLPFQWNSYFETGPKGKTQNAILIQPVIPITLNEDWNFITRPIIPLVEMPPLIDGQNRNHGLGNVQFQGFFSPKEPVNDWIIGFGAYLEFPTKSGPDGRFGSDNWSAGPAFVALQMKGQWVYGALISQLWSYSGNDPEVNLTSIQPFLNYNMADGWYLSASPVITANWSADSSETWTIPIGGGIGKVFKVGKQPVNAAIKAYHNVESPRAGADWQLQFQIQFLFPK